MPGVVSRASKRSAARQRSPCPVDDDCDDVDDGDEDGGRRPWSDIVCRRPAVAHRSKCLRFARDSPSVCGGAL